MEWNVLSTEKDFEIKGKYCNATELFKELAHLVPDILISELEIQGISSGQLTLHIKRNIVI